MHLRPIGRAGWLGRHIAVRAVDNYGEVVRVLLDARYGDVVSVVPLAAAVGGYRPYGAQSYRPFGAHPYRPYGAARAGATATARSHGMARSRGMVQRRRI